ncbi:ribose 5-phosphate isomerase B [Haloactinopolyspora alba]|uniref:D-erythrulose 4-phosphate isomerase n=1 Tax=Haloactinopolyspora alba TaxID=648780 RepID=A0A2P8E5L4_9ACTN|nr:ribose-5-phosphate isomerase [Haloactinopolyspora alba]PSL04758.1 ribose 5-phosphate isomerase B [Haloactinopolyspora alba]
MAEQQQWRIVVGADDAGMALKDLLAEALRGDDRVEVVTDLGVHDAGDERTYPDVGLAAAQRVADGEADRALLVCGTGIGMAIAANKVPDVRATVAHDSYSVQRSVLSNNCQVLTMGSRVVGPELARLLATEWLGLTFDDGSASADKVAVISAFERRAG